MSGRNTGGPAFPSTYEWVNDSDLVNSSPNGNPIAPGGSDVVHFAGMTLRDYFAAKAAQGILSNAGEFMYSDVAFAAYGVADAMLRERAK